MKHFLLPVIFLLLPFVSLQAEPVQLFEATYRIERFGLRVAKVQRQLSKEGKHYLFHSTSSVHGLASLFTDQRHVEQSRLMLSDEALLPLEYSYHREGSKPRQRGAYFDWEQGLLRLRDGEQRQELQLEHGTWDRLSAELLLMQDLRRGSLPEHYRLTDGRAVKKYRVVREAEEWLDTALGNLRTVRILHLRERDQRRIIFWCAEKLHYLPVRIEYIKSGGARYTASIESYHARPEAVSPTDQAAGW